MGARPVHACLGCGYDLSGTPADESGAWLCPECGRPNSADAYYLALQQMMRPGAWIATVAGLTAFNTLVTALMVVNGRYPGFTCGFGVFCCLCEAALVCAIAGRRAQATVRANKMLLLAGALCCFWFVASLLVLVALSAARLGRL